MNNLPKGWSFPTLGDITIKSQYGSNSLSRGGIYPILGMKNIHSGKINQHDMPFVDLNADELKKFRLNVGDILINRTNSLELVGKTAIFELSGDFVFASYLVRFILNHKVVVPNYFNYYCNSHIGKYRIRRLATKGVSQSNINPTELKKNLHIPLPPLPEQQKIAQILSTWDEAIVKTEQLIAALERRKKGLMQRLLTGQVRFPGFEGEWREIKLNDLGTRYSGLSGKTKEDFGVGKPFIPYKNVFQNYSIDKEHLDFVQLEEGDNQNKVVKGDILFTISSETADEVAMSSVLLNDLGECYLNSFCFGLSLNDFGTLLSEFAVYYFRGADFRKKTYKLAQGFTRYNISKLQLMKQDVLLPSIAEQRKIAEILQSCDDEIRLFEMKLSSLKNQKKGLMQRLLTGQVRVKVDG